MNVYTERDNAVMVELQREVSDLLLRFRRERELKGTVAIFTLARVMRELLNKFPERERAMLVDQIIFPFLQNEHPGGDDGRIITLQ